MPNVILTDDEFNVYQKFIYNETGIALSKNKKILVQSRLQKRLSFYKMRSFNEYMRLVQLNRMERSEMLNLITTNETYFFRESRHFDFLIDKVLPHFPYDRPFRAWSAAASIGAEAYTIAMVVDTYLRSKRWEILGTDINSDVLKKAVTGLYPIRLADKIPENYLKMYCLKGKGPHEGKFLMDRSLLANIRFEQANLLNLQADYGLFDVVFLRNVLLYFDVESKQKVIDNVIQNIMPGGYLFISHTENLNGLRTDKLVSVQTSIYRKKE